MKTQSAAFPFLILIGLALLFLGATIDIICNTVVSSYRFLKPYTLRSVQFLTTYISATFISLGDRLTQYFYQVDNESGTLPSVADAIYCSLGQPLRLLMIDLGKALGHIGNRLQETPKTTFEEEINRIWE